MFPDYLPTIDEIVAFLRSERAKDLAILNMKEVSTFYYRFTSLYHLFIVFLSLVLCYYYNF